MARKVTVNPAQVKSLKVSSRKTNSLKLIWTKQSGITGYKIYQYNRYGKLIKTVTGNTNSYTLVIKCRSNVSI